MKGFRTVLFAVIVAVIGVLEGFEWANIVPDSLEPVLLPVIAAIFLWLRSLTDTKIGKSK